MSRRILTVLGTRPEAIKFASLINRLDQDDRITHAVCSTGQHKEMLQQVLDVFGIAPAYDLKLMTHGQNLTQILGTMLSALSPVIEDFRPDTILVQGDTTTAFGAAAAAFYSRVKVAHIEAGLRTGDMDAPYPEEGNRRLIGVVADWHFAPTQRAKSNLLREGVDPANIRVTGNTGIDALLYMRDRLRQDHVLRGACETAFDFINPRKKLVLVTGHRRENFGEGLKRIFSGLAKIAARPDTQVIYPVHLNPNVRGPAQDMLKDVSNLFLINPVEYHQMVYLMDRASLIVTDSGGIQEEAPSFGVPVLVTRDVTERQEAVDAGAARLVGTDPHVLVTEANKSLDAPRMKLDNVSFVNPFGDGRAALRIHNTLMGDEQRKDLARRASHIQAAE
ncbi:MAG: UDP-N-acetylglucosamine 2-epimerase (non-hydrolyzing) [Rhodospirillaceae bacterium]|nr:UDP-N-acetylglucosamine 2-epimerase (non-hydrolyzing) [Rhodospirillaceae bacterium]